MGSKGSWVGDYYRVKNPMQYGFPLYYTPEGSSELFTEMFGSWTGYEGKFAFGWDYLLKQFSGGWVTVNPGAFQEHTQVPWAEIPRKKVDEAVLSNYGPDVALQEDRLSSQITTDVHTTAFSGGFKYDPYCLKPVSGWPSVEVNKHVMSTGQWEDPEGTLYDEEGKTFNRSYTNLSEVSHPTDTPLAIHMEKNPSLERIPNLEDLRNLGHYTEVYVAKQGQQLNTSNQIVSLEYYVSRPDNGSLALDVGEKCWEHAREDSDGTLYWIIDDYQPSHFEDFASGQSSKYNVYAGFKSSNTPGILVQSGPDQDPMWTSESWTQEDDTTLAQRKQDWIDENCTGDDWISPRPDCNIENKINYITV